MDFSAIGQIPGFVAALILIAFASKLAGSGLPAYWLGLSKRESLMVGVGMSGRGAVELIVAGIALDAGLFLHPQSPPAVISGLFSAVVLMALVTTVVTPVVLHWLAPK